MERCGADPLFYIDSFIWQYNPLKVGFEVDPFVLYDYQIKAVTKILDCIENGKDLVIDKSREIGATWFCLIPFLYLWHFRRNRKFLCMSRNEPLVDSKDQDSLFWKLRFMVRCLPPWLRPDHVDTKLYLGNLKNDSSLTGVATTADAGVGGRATAMFIDEFSRFKDGFEVFHHTSDVANCRIFNSTHTGTDTCFYQLTDPNSLAGSYIQKLQVHWSEHPEKIDGLYRVLGGKLDVLDKQYEFPEDFKFCMDGSPNGGPFPGLRSPWYDRACKRKGSARAVAMDLDINPQGSQSQVVNPAMIRAYQETYCVEPFWTGEIHFERDTGKPLGLRKSPGGKLKLWALPDADGNLPKAPYSIGGDISTGNGTTPSCLSIMNCKTGEKVGSYVNASIYSHDLAPMATALGWHFRDEDDRGAKLVWEMQGPGDIYGKIIMGLGYSHVHYRRNEEQYFKSQPEDRPGWSNGPKQFDTLFREYIFALEHRKCINRCQESLEETLFFRYETTGHIKHSGESGGDDPSGARVNHGDRVVADALAWKMVAEMGQLEELKKKQEAEEVKPGIASLASRRLWLNNKRRQVETT